MDSASTPLFTRLPIYLFNTYSRKKQLFVPRVAGQVGMYVCGITPYNYAHIGNARPAVVFDTLFRFLQAVGYHVTYVRNFTDVDDKIINRAAEEGVSPQQISEKYINIYLEDMQKLNVSLPTHQPKVSETIPEIIRLIEKNIRNGFAYVAPHGDVMYSVENFIHYGKLSAQNLNDLQAGARVAVEEGKRHPADFVLWKKAKPGEPSWPSPWGEGRPGWHIECSAMSEKFLGPQFDIHGGGEDLQFPHHENEIAQSYAAHCTTCENYQYAAYWVHNAFVNINGDKMSKSLGNFKTVHSLLAQHPGETLRFWLLSGHYRKPIDLTDHALQSAQGALESLYMALEKTPPEATETTTEPARVPDALHAFYAALANDLNTPEALALCFEEAKQANKGNRQASANLKAMGKVLGLLQQPPRQFLQQGSAVDTAEIETLLQQRNEAKQAKNYTKADAIRAQLLAQGVVLEDTPTGTTWRRG